MGPVARALLTGLLWARDGEEAHLRPVLEEERQGRPSSFFGCDGPFFWLGQQYQHAARGESLTP